MLDGIISILNQDLSVLFYSSYLAEKNDWDFIYGMERDDNGLIYLTGHRISPDYPTMENSFDNEHNGVGGQRNDNNVFVTIINDELSEIESSTFLWEGRGFDIGYNILKSKDSKFIITVTIKSSYFPTTIGAYDST